LRKHGSPKVITTDKLASYGAALRKHGIFKSPGKLYPSLAVTEADLDHTRDAVRQAVRTTFLD